MAQALTIDRRGETELVSLPCAPKPHSLQRLGSYVDLGKLDPSLQEMAVTLKKLLGSSGINGSE